MKALKIIDSLLQIGFIVIVLILLKSEPLKSSLLITYLYLGPYQLFSQFIHFIIKNKSRLRKNYVVGVIVFFLGLFLSSTIVKLIGLTGYIVETLGTVSFFLSTTLLAVFYIYITFAETYEEIGK